MFYVGTKEGVVVWFVLWGNKETNFCSELYKTAYGLRQWLTNPAFRDMPIVRIGMAVLTPEGWVEKESWLTKEEFLSAK